MLSQEDPILSDSFRLMTDGVLEIMSRVRAFNSSSSLWQEEAKKEEVKKEEEVKEANEEKKEEASVCLHKFLAELSE